MPKKTGENFTHGRIEAYRCPSDKQQAFFWDSACPGLGIRCTQNGAKAYVYKTRTSTGKQFRVTLGPVATLDIKEAREKARQLRSMADSGVTPADQSKADAAETDAVERDKIRQAITLGDAWPKYIEANSDCWSAKHTKAHHDMMQAPGMPRKRSSVLTVAGPLWALRDVKLVDLSPDLLIDWIKAENKIRPTQAALANRLLFACLRWCWEARDNKQKVYALDNPEALRTKSYVKRVQTTKAGNHGSLGRDQLTAWFKEVRRIQNPVVSAFLQSCLLTGARPWQELAKLRWADVDFRWRRMKLHDKATSEGAQEGFRIIPLTPYVASLISGLPRRNEFVFSGTAGNDHLVDIRKSYHPALIAAGLDGPTVYGLRGSFATLAEYDDDVAPPAGVIAQIMGHTPSATAEKHYKKREIDSLYQRHTKIEAWILAQAGIDQPAETDKPNRLHVVGGNQ